MNERIIRLTEVNPKEFYGSNNSNIVMLQKYFPQVKIIARGAEIKIFGAPEVLDEFEKKVGQLADYYLHYNKLEEHTVEQILTNDQDSKHHPNLIDGILVHGVGGKIIKAQTDNQRKMVEAIGKNDLMFAVGPAGTGKTYTAVALAVQALKENQVKRIILTRPAVESGENLGFLPGDLKEKLDPYMQPLYDALRDMLPPSKLESYFENSTIEIAPLAFMRGRTLDNAFVILDEAQNTNHRQMKMFLTRMGKNAKFIITGDPGQIDLPKNQKSGLKEAINCLKSIKGISFIFLDGKDVIRHRLVKDIIDAYEEEESKVE